MSKELEALRVLKANAILFDDGTDFGASMLEAISELDKFLKPPTSDDVCKALKSYFEHHVDEVFYDNDDKSFKDENIPNLVEYLFDITYIKDIPPHIITLIGKFYQSEAQE